MAKKKRKAQKEIIFNERLRDDDDAPVHMMYVGVITGVLANYHTGKINNIPEFFLSGVQGAALVIPHALFRHGWCKMGLAQKDERFSLSNLAYITTVGSAIGAATAAFLNDDALKGMPSFNKGMVLGVTAGGFLAACNYFLQCYKPQCCRILGAIGLSLFGYELFGVNGAILGALNVAAENYMQEKLFSTSAISIGSICTGNVEGGIVGLGVVIGYNLVANNLYNEGYAIGR